VIDSLEHMYYIKLRKKNVRDRETLVAGGTNRHKRVFTFSFLYKTYATMLRYTGIVKEKYHSTNNGDRYSNN
jgi:hypothetical protein